jgi:hypothetical protein
MTERIGVNATNELLVGGTPYEGLGGAQAPGGGTEGVLIPVHRTGCACGWKSEWRATKELARNDAKIHSFECNGESNG